jgi:hypothetical protein
MHKGGGASSAAAALAGTISFPSEMLYAAFQP